MNDSADFDIQVKNIYKFYGNINEYKISLFLFIVNSECALIGAPSCLIINNF